MMEAPMFLIIHNVRSFLTAVTANAVTQTAVTPTVVFFLELEPVFT